MSRLLRFASIISIDSLLSDKFILLSFYRNIIIVVSCIFCHENKYIVHNVFIPVSLIIMLYLGPLSVRFFPWNEFLEFYDSIKSVKFWLFFKKSKGILSPWHGNMISNFREKKWPFLFITHKKEIYLPLNKL